MCRAGRSSNSFALPAGTSGPGCLGLFNPGARGHAATPWLHGWPQVGQGQSSVLAQIRGPCVVSQALTLYSRSSLFFLSLPEEVIQLYFTCTRRTWHLEVRAKVTPLVKERAHPHGLDFRISRFGSYQVGLKQDTLGPSSLPF